MSEATRCECGHLARYHTQARATPGTICTAGGGGCRCLQFRAEPAPGKLTPSEVTEPGWYWTHLDQRGEPVIIEITPDIGDRAKGYGDSVHWIYGGTDVDCIDYPHGFTWFVGPLAPPEGE